MINLIIKEDEVKGYAMVDYSSDDDEEIIVKKSKDELNDLDENWKDKRIGIDENEKLYIIPQEEE